MITKCYYLTEFAYRKKLRPFLRIIGEEIDNPTIRLVSPYAEAYKLRSGQSVAYAKGVVLVGATRTREVKSLESKAKKIGAKLTEIVNQKL